MVCSLFVIALLKRSGEAKSNNALVHYDIYFTVVWHSRTIGYEIKKISALKYTWTDLVYDLDGSIIKIQAKIGCIHIKERKTTDNKNGLHAKSWASCEVKMCSREVMLSLSLIVQGKEPLNFGHARCIWTLSILTFANCADPEWRSPLIWIYTVCKYHQCTL